MNDHIYPDASTRTGTIGGTLVAVLLNMFTNDIVRTIGFAALGATVSFFVSLGWKWLIRKWKKRKNRPRTGRPA